MKSTDVEELNADILDDCGMFLTFVMIPMINMTTGVVAVFESVVNKHAPFKRKRGHEKDLPYVTTEWKKRFEVNETMPPSSQKIAQKRILTSRRSTTYWSKKSAELQESPLCSTKSSNH